MLVVDDEPLLLEMLAMALRQAGHEVTAVPTVRQATAALAAGSFDLLLTDLDLPDGSGCDVAECALSAHRGIRIVFMTGGCSSALERFAARHGRPVVLWKPFSFEDLRACLCGALSAQRAV